MNADSLRQVCREHASASLNSLVMACRQRFVDAARLMEWDTPVLAHLSGLGIRTPPELWLLFPASSLMCDRYIEAFYSPQRTLVSSPDDEPDQKWWRYFHHQLVPGLIANDDVVRNVLRAVGGLPCTDPQEAARVLCHHLAEMTLPDCLPGWAPASA